MQNIGITLYVADTHSIIWYLLDSSQLGKRANLAFTEVENGTAKLLIPAIVIAEIIFLIQKGKVNADIDEVITRIQNSDNFKITTLGLDILVLFKELNQIPEMHDRLIVSEALLNNARIITKDREITKSKSVQVVW